MIEKRTALVRFLAPSASSLHSRDGIYGDTAKHCRDQALGRIPLRALCDHDMISTVVFRLSTALSHLTRGNCCMDERIVEAIARRAGLEKALEGFPDDVAAAATSADRVTDRIRQSGGALPEPLSEPWPPMIVVGR